MAGSLAGEDGAGVILLMRHGQHTDGRLTDAALTDTRNVTRRLVDWLDGESRGRKQHEVVIVATGSPEVMQTARTVYYECRTALPKIETQRSRHRPTIKVTWGGSLADDTVAKTLKLPPVDDPRVLGAYQPDTCVIEKHRTKLSEAVMPNKSVLLVGNDPFVGWLASGLTGRDTALARGELLCLCRRPESGGWRALWNIAVEPPTLAADLRAKIKSKMDSAKALGAVVVALLTYLLTRGLTELPSPWTWLAVAVLGLAAWFYFAALFLYDSLLMPSRFWGNRLRGPEPTEEANCLRRRIRQWWGPVRRWWGRGPRAVQRPPASTERLLHDGMIHVWIWVFQPATFLVGVGVVLLAVAAATRGPAQPTAPGLAQSTAPGLLTVLLVTAGLAVFAVLYVLWHRPRLGASD